mgnify:FL=1
MPVQTRLQKKNLGKKYMRVLELFSGTGSVKKICNELGWDCVSVDITSELHPVDYEVNILEWDYTKLAKDSFDIIWASPPCNSFSSMLFLTPSIDQAKLIEEQGLPLLYKTLEIIDYFNPKYFFMENPDGGKMKDFVSELIPYIRVCYCRYGYHYKKPTRIWTNAEYEGKWCECKGKHKKSIGTTRATETDKFKTGTSKKNMKLAQKYSIPPKLISELFDSVV